MTFIENNKNGVVYMTSPNISAPHAFSTRYGGVSTGYLSSMNLGENRGDLRENLIENYNIFCKAVGCDPERLVFSKQVHETNVRVVSADDIHKLCTPIPYECDGMITNEKNLSLVIFSADCIPVLLFDPIKKVIGACHCGWRGTVADMAGNTVRKMCEVYSVDPANIQASIGPGIDKCCFVTDSDVSTAVYDCLGNIGKKYVESLTGGKFKVDLKGINRYLLSLAGLKDENISVSDECTACNPDKYWSHRITHGQRGTQCAMIWLD